ncbi:hypothetical protein A5780_19315 [Nocardia sp. 852002-20019_SCH5090214]|uniref:hypothetical protein n=1 Tax=Nocardia sp. 852002-20019_SCH5090214 TaxID=1834087 RepID=UPI0007EA8825|nr:hypothetical protein [Nocardia sp. 852002-20019_SCH5090214]OBA62209.1 hypothetical protein A5780_19315 [Nocardia sp. 852002-20019_SCH5090214]
MTHDEVISVLQTAATYDGRKPADSLIDAWTQAAWRAGWSYDDALDAVHQHYSASTDWIMPGHVTKLIRTGGNSPQWQE